MIPEPRALRAVAFSVRVCLSLDTRSVLSPALPAPDVALIRVIPSFP